MLNSVFLTVFWSVFCPLFCNPRLHRPIQTQDRKTCTRASTSKGRERPPLFARPAARKATRDRSRPFASYNALCIRPHWVSTAANNYKPAFNRPAHRSPKNIFQIRRAFFLSRIFPTSCPLVEIEVSSFHESRHAFLETAWGKSKSALLSCESKRSMKRPNTTVRNQEN